MKKYVIIAIIVNIIAIVSQVVLQLKFTFSIFNMVRIVGFFIIIYKLFKNEHDKFFAIGGLFIPLIFNVIVGVEALMHTIIYEQFHTTMPWFDILTHTMNIICILPSALVLIMSISRLNCNEIEHPAIPAILHLIFSITTVSMFTYISNNSAGTFYYDTLSGIISIFVGTISNYCICKFIQNS